LAWGVFLWLGFAKRYAGLERWKHRWLFIGAAGNARTSETNFEELVLKSIPLGGMFLEGMPMSPRPFKTKHFAMLAAKAWIGDDELRQAFTEMLNGQADNLGGGVWKKRLNANRHRSIVLARGSYYWVYQFIYAKKDQSNISQAELIGFRKMAKTYQGLTEMQVQYLLDTKAFTEIFYE
jgi:hypothetical protein